MTVLFAGAMNYEFGNAPTLDTIPGRYDPDYALGAITKAGPFNYATTFITGTADEYWMHAQVLFGNMTTAGRDRMPLFGLYTSIGDWMGGLSLHTEDLILSLDPNDIEVASTRINVNGLIPKNVLVDVDLHYYQFGSVRAVELYISGVLVARRSKSQNVMKPAQAVFSGMAVNSCSYSEVIITEGNEPTLGWRLHSKLPNGSLPGINTFNSGYWGSLGNKNLNDGVVSRSSGARITGGFDAYTGPAAPLGIRGIMQSARYLKNSSILDLRGQLRIGGVNYDDADQEVKDASRIMSFWENNPVDGEPFDVSDFAGLQGGFRTVSV